MPENDTRVIGEGRYLRLVDWRTWEYVERLNIRGIVIIIPVTDDGKVVFIDQFRAPLRARVVEFPAGLVGDEEQHEDIIEATRRELREETGYDAQELVPVAEGTVSPGSTSETVTVFLAKGLKKVAEGGGVGKEDIEVNEVPRAEIRPWLDAMKRKGRLIDLKVFMGLYFVEREYGPAGE